MFTFTFSWVWVQMRSHSSWRQLWNWLDFEVCHGRWEITQKISGYAILSNLLFCRSNVSLQENIHYFMIYTFFQCGIAVCATWEKEGKTTFIIRACLTSTGDTKLRIKGFRTFLCIRRWAIWLKKTQNGLKEWFLSYLHTWAHFLVIFVYFVLFY